MGEGRFWLTKGVKWHTVYSVMKLSFDEKLAANYKSPSQKIRVMTEGWVHSSLFCPNCGRASLEKYGNSKPVADFYCDNCLEDYELKSQKSGIGKKIVDGAYKTMIERLLGSNNPNFFLLNYHPSRYEVRNLFVVPKHFFVPRIIEKRKPLGPTAERHGWVGCNILLTHIPETGKIFFVRDARKEPKGKVLDAWQKTLFLREEKEISAKGWLLDVMSCVDNVGKKDFTLDDVYMFADELGTLHPDNKHVKDKIRQQLQVLRDKGYITFVSRGRYRLS